MSKLTLDLASFKSSGVYTMEIDNSITEVVETDSLRLVPGFSEKPPFNRPVYLNGPDDKAKIFGSGNNSKLERRGSFFDRTLNIMLNDDPVIALNLMPIDTTSDEDNNPDKVGTASFSLAGEDDKSLHVLDMKRYFEFFDRSRFWIPSAENLLYVNAQAANVGNGIEEIKTNLHKAPIFNIVNIGTSDVTVFVIKDNDVTGYNTTFANWYGNSPIPYSWIRPNDYVSDYFVKVIVLKGDWTNLDTLKTDITWNKYFDDSGLKLSELNKFLRADGVSVMGTWSGIILPNFYNKAGKLVSIEPLVNNYTTQTGVMIALNESAMETIINDASINEQYYDDNYNGEYDSNDITPVNYGIDLVGHYISSTDENVKLLSYKDISVTNIIEEITCESGDEYKVNDDTNRLVKLTNNMFIINLGANPAETVIGVGDYVEAANGGLTRVIKKQTAPSNVALYTCLDPVKFKNASTENRGEGVYLHKTLSSVFTHIEPTKLTGLKLTNRHRPGFDKDGNASIEAGVEKIYAMLEDEGIKRGLKNKEMISFRYIVDSMAGGIGAGLGGKLHLANLAKEVGKCTALINFPSVAQLTMSTDPLFCDNSMANSISKSFDTKFIPTGGNQDSICSEPLTMPLKDEGADYAAVFSPFLKYRDGARTILIPPAAHVASAFNKKYKGGDPYMTVANLNGTLNDSNIVGLEYMYDDQDRDNLEPFGVNPIISQRGRIMIYGDRTCYQEVISDLNYIHVRELLNTIELECQEVLKRYVFRTNDSLTRAEIVRKLTPILEEKVTSGALYNFEITMDETNNTAEIINRSFGVVDIAVYASKNMEKIVQRITIEKLAD